MKALPAYLRHRTLNFSPNRQKFSAAKCLRPGYSLKRRSRTAFQFFAVAVGARRIEIASYRLRLFDGVPAVSFDAGCS